MNRKKVVVLSLSLSMLLLTLTYGAVVRATPEERRIVYSMDFLGLKVSVVAPDLADPGENITVTVRADASGDIDIEYIHVNIYGLKNETEKISLADKYIRTVPHQDDYIITIPNDTSPGLLYGILEWKWMYTQSPGMDVIITPPPAGFAVTYVRNVELEKLQDAYDELNVTYNSLLANYTELKMNYTELKNYKNELGATRNLMYVFVATTIVSAATAFILLIRGPKRLWT